MKVHRSRIEVLRILMYLDVHGVEATMKRYHIDKRTLTNWQSKEPAGWEREEELNRLVMAEAHIDGTVKYRDAAVGRGIAWDKLWRIARRKEVEQRRAEEQPQSEQPDVLQLAIDALRDDQQRLLRDGLDTVMLEQGDPVHPHGDPPAKSRDADHEADMLAWIASVAALSESEIATRSAELDARQAEARDLIDAEATPEPEPPAPPPPEAIQAAPARSPRPVGQVHLRVLSDAERQDPLEHDHPSWTRII